MISQNIGGVPETLLIPPWALGIESRRNRPIITDPLAVDVVRRIDYDFSVFDGEWMMQPVVAINGFGSRIVRILFHQGCSSMSFFKN